MLRRIETVTKKVYAYCTVVGLIVCPVTINNMDRYKRHDLLCLKEANGVCLVTDDVFPVAKIDTKHAQYSAWLAAATPE